MKLMVKEIIELVAMDKLSPTYIETLNDLEEKVAQLKAEYKAECLVKLLEEGKETKSGGMELIVGDLRISRTKPVGTKYIDGQPDKKFIKVEVKPNTEAINAYIAENNKLPDGIAETVRDGNLKIERVKIKKERVKLSSGIENPLKGIKFKKRLDN